MSRTNLRTNEVRGWANTKANVLLNTVIFVYKQNNVCSSKKSAKSKYMAKNVKRTFFFNSKKKTKQCYVCVRLYSVSDHDFEWLLKAGFSRKFNIKLRIWLIVFINIEWLNTEIWIRPQNDMEGCILSFHQLSIMNMLWKKIIYAGGERYVWDFAAYLSLLTELSI